VPFVHVAKFQIGFGDVAGRSKGLIDYLICTYSKFDTSLRFSRFGLTLRVTFSAGSRSLYAYHPHNQTFSIKISLSHSCRILFDLPGACPIHLWRMAEQLVVKMLAWSQPISFNQEKE